MMPQHEALRAIMLGTQQVYYEEFSVLGNPFDSWLATSEAQLLRLYVLTAIVNLSSERGPVAKLVGIEGGGVVSGVVNFESSDV